MDVLTFAELRASLDETLTRVCHNREVIIVTMADAKACAMVPLEEYNRLQALAAFSAEAAREDDACKRALCS